MFFIKFIHIVMLEMVVTFQITNLKERIKTKGYLSLNEISISLFSGGITKQPICKAIM